MSSAKGCIALLVCLSVCIVSTRTAAAAGCTKKCPRGYHCEQETIYCITTPCPQPLPQCVKDQYVCPQARCSRSCSMGYQYDANNCQTCECICPELDCSDSPCVNGYKTDADGCQTCTCNEWHCTGVTCGITQCVSNQVCQEVDCFTAPFDPVCVDPTTNESPSWASVLTTTASETRLFSRYFVFLYMLSFSYTLLSLYTGKFD